MHKVCAAVAVPKSSQHQHPIVKQKSILPVKLIAQIISVVA